MSKRKKQPTKPAKRGIGWFRHPKEDLEPIYAQADRLIDDNRPQEAVTLLEPYLASHPRRSNCTTTSPMPC